MCVCVCADADADLCRYVFVCVCVCADADAALCVYVFVCMHTDADGAALGCLWRGLGGFRGELGYRDVGHRSLLGFNGAEPDKERRGFYTHSQTELGRIEHDGANSTTNSLTARDVAVPLGGLPRSLGTDWPCLLYTSPIPRDRTRSRMPSSA